MLRSLLLRFLFFSKHHLQDHGSYTHYPRRLAVKKPYSQKIKLVRGPPTLCCIPPWIPPTLHFDRLYREILSVSCRSGRSESTFCYLEIQITRRHPTPFCHIEGSELFDATTASLSAFFIFNVVLVSVCGLHPRFNTTAVADCIPVTLLHSVCIPISLYTTAFPFP